MIYLNVFFKGKGKYDDVFKFYVSLGMIFFFGY